MAYTAKENILENAKPMRAAIAESMVKSWHTSPKCDYFMKCDAGKMMEYRKAYEEKHDVKISHFWKEVIQFNWTP